ncbi:hypothetical protein GQ55_4G049500 [Panicum hallii var. hallii]|uniref:J domain-containing protein n=1 Tax=Panicum hallii var. hallii TaxID=1504633 RepID=A0A2T7DVD3_9POAL|nr:hypothetical protein GQ55_4G049500 [Panicum hallii var. hallii]
MTFCQKKRKKNRRGEGPRFVILGTIGYGCHLASLRPPPVDSACIGVAPLTARSAAYKRRGRQCSPRPACDAHLAAAYRCRGRPQAGAGTPAVSAFPERGRSPARGRCSPEPRAPRRLSHAPRFRARGVVPTRLFRTGRAGALASLVFGVLQDRRVGGPVQAFQSPASGLQREQGRRRAAMGGGSGRPCYYAVLGVSRETSAADISAAYRRQALKWHPDKLQLQGDDDDRRWAREEAKARFQQLQEAYEVLSDASKKAAYDRDVVVVFPSESDLAKTFQAMDDLLDEMDGLVESMKQFLSRIKQEPNLTMDDMLAMMDEEIKKCCGDQPRAPGRWTPPSCSAAGTSAAGAQAAGAGDARGKSSSSTPRPRGTKCPPPPGFYGPFGRTG